MGARVRDLAAAWLRSTSRQASRSPPDEAPEPDWLRSTDSRVHDTPYRKMCTEVTRCPGAHRPEGRPGSAAVLGADLRRQYHQRFVARNSRRRAVRVRRVVRRVELWSALRLALAFHVSCFAVTTPAFVVMFSMARRFGAIEGIEGVLTRNGFASGFQVNGDLLFNWWVAFGPLLVAFNTLATMVGVLLFNALSGLTGGLVFSVLEETSTDTGARPTKAERRARRARRLPVATPKAPRTRRRSTRSPVGAGSGVARPASAADGSAAADQTWTAPWTEDEQGTWLRPTETAGSTPGAVV